MLRTVPLKGWKIGVRSTAMPGNSERVTMIYSVLYLCDVGKWRCSCTHFIPLKCAFHHLILIVPIHFPSRLVGNCLSGVLRVISLFTLVCIWFHFWLGQRCPPLTLGPFLVSFLVPAFFPQYFVPLTSLHLALIMIIPFQNLIVMFCSWDAASVTDQTWSHSSLTPLNRGWG